MLTKMTSCDFIDAVASDAPAPGGGGAAAMAGALGMALGGMVGSLTLRSKRYEDVHADIGALKARAAALQQTLLELVERDAAAFEPLAAAYKIPKDDPARAEIMEKALYEACLPPLEIMKACADCIGLHREFAQKGTRMAISDVGVGAALCAAALQGASLNVFINTASMADRALADALDAQALELLDAVYRADDLFEEVAVRCANVLRERRWHRQ
ncbi:MAG: cyclodeaminase/cyclohydrolase family protein [Oscillospiraceae bacterium]|nr:cyclodeaminase/cyclohydrolase family protein [Oscillospiraceae bacterium]